MVSAAAKGAAVAQSKATGTSTEKKVVVPREDPVLRAERLLNEAKEKAAITAKAQVDNARETYERSEKNLEKWTRLRDEAKARFSLLAERAGVAGPAGDVVEETEPNAGQELADAINENTEANGIGTSSDE